MSKNFEGKEEKFFEIWEIYESMNEKVYDLEQSFYYFGEKLKENFREKSKENATDFAIEMPSGSKDGNDIPFTLSNSICPGICHPLPSEAVFDHYMDVLSTFFSFASHHHPLFLLLKFCLTLVCLSQLKNMLSS